MGAALGRTEPGRTERGEESMIQPDARTSSVGVTVPRVNIASHTHIRWLLRADMSAIAAFEGEDLHGWGQHRLMHAMRHRDVIALVAEVGEKVVGFAVYLLRPKRLEVLRIAVHPDWRRRGIGSRLLGNIMQKIGGPGTPRQLLRLYVPEGNLAACLWLRAGGVRAVGIEAGIEVGSGEVDEYDEDLIRFEYRRD